MHIVFCQVYILKACKVCMFAYFFISLSTVAATDL